MLIGLGQVETPDDIGTAVAAGWAGDFVHTYRPDNIDISDYFDAARAVGQKVSLSIPSTDAADLVNIVTVATDNLDILHGYYVEDITDVAEVNTILSVCGDGGGTTCKNRQPPVVIYDNSLPMTGGASVHAKGERFSRLWYPFVRETTYDTWSAANGDPAETQSTQAQYFIDHPEVARSPISMFPLWQMRNFIESNRNNGRVVSGEMWVQAIGEPADDPTYKHREFDSTSLRPQYVQPRIEQMWWQLAACDAVGCAAAIYYTFTQQMDGMDPTLQHLPDIQPVMWSEINKAIVAFKNNEVPDTWNAPEAWLAAV